MELFKNFLVDNDEYHRATECWNDTCREIFEKYNQLDEWEPWFNLKYNDGTPMRDGNPITTWVNNIAKKGIRIIQVDKQFIPITAHMNIFDRDVSAIPELVIRCFLSEKTLQHAKELLENWISGIYEYEAMEDRIKEVLPRCE